MLVFEKFGQHQPLSRQAERFAREGVNLSLSTLDDLIGHATVASAPIHALIERHVLTAGRLHCPSRLWTYVRNNAPFNCGAPPAALFHFSRDREGQHPEKHLAGW